ncbi:MAG: DUF4340 domain-containing protein [Myxococcota bacterium]
MKRSTWITLAVFAALLVVYLVKTMRTETSAPPPLDIAGYLGNVSEDEARALSKGKPSPVTKITLRRAGEVISIEKQPAKAAPPADKVAADAPAPEEVWTAIRTAKGKQTQTKAQSFRVKGMAEAPMRTLRSSFTLPVTKKDLAEYGLDAEHALDVDLTLPDRTIKLRIGAVAKPEASESGQPGDPSTWVQDPARPEFVYQIPSRDLRTTFDVTWTDLRDRALLDLDTAAVTRLEVTPPADKGVKVVLERPALTPKQRKALDDKKQKREDNEGWTMVEPAGVRVGEVGEWLGALSRLSATDFVDAADAAAKKTVTGFDDPKVATRIAITVSGKPPIVIDVGGSDESRPTKDVWLRVQGRDEWVLVPSYVRDQAVMTVDQLRDRRLLGDMKAKEAKTFSIQAGDVQLSARRDGSAWTLTAPALATSTRAVDSYLSELETTKVEFVKDRQPADVGLGSPTWKITLQFDGSSCTVALGTTQDGSTFGQATVDGVPGELFKLTSWNADKLKKKAQDFADRKLFPLARDEVTEIHLESKDAGKVLLRKAADGTWQVAEGDNAAAPAQKQAVDDLLASLTNLEYTSDHSDRNAADTGLLKDYSQVQALDRSGRTFELRVSSQKNGEDFFAGLVKAGRVARVVAIGSVPATSLAKKPSDFHK